ncbi:hypothetical protein [Tenacibaculum sp. IB213877]|uniref:hypothetical protein n=1 Tax=Tenacibaculum sp. IB213877 TaxID=3097351 RepID=UPI002A5A30D4|nr:hypothetical protein [Tenacibaculum sp. IB213877]MDY0779237.1 hypothetical protein [Tenacibaculum sp. IB213877]
MKIDLKENIDFLKFFKNNTSLILLGVYILSFINYYIYYKSFKIPIFNYIGLNDMLFFTLEYIFKIILIIFLSEVFLFFIFGILFMFYEKIVIFLVKKKGKLYLKSDNKNRNRIKDLFIKPFNKGLINFRFSIVFISIFFIPTSGNVLLLFPTLLVYLIYYLEKVSKEKMYNLTFIFFCGIIILFLTFTTLVNLYEKRSIKDDYKISFIENSNYISTDRSISCYNYLGETSSHIFLYNIERKESRICSKSNITELIIKNENFIDSLITRIKENSMFKFLKESLKL